MTSRDFAFWLQGFFELNPDLKQPTQEQTKIIKRHLNLVFAHDIDPSMGDSDHQGKLNSIHDGDGTQIGNTESTVDQFEQLNFPFMNESPFNNNTGPGKLRC